MIYFETEIGEVCIPTHNITAIAQAENNYVVMTNDGKTWETNFEPTVAVPVHIASAEIWCATRDQRSARMVWSRLPLAQLTTHVGALTGRPMGDNRVHALAQWPSGGVFALVDRTRQTWALVEPVGEGFAPYICEWTEGLHTLVEVMTADLKRHMGDQRVLATQPDFLNS